MIKSRKPCFSTWKEACSFTWKPWNISCRNRKKDKAGERQICKAVLNWLSEYDWQQHKEN